MENRKKILKIRNKLLRMKKKEVIKYCGYKNIKAVYKDLGNKIYISKKYLIKLILS